MTCSARTRTNLPREKAGGCRRSVGKLPSSTRLRSSSPTRCACFPLLPSLSMAWSARRATHASEWWEQLSASPHYLGKWLKAHRNVTHHYPKMHPDAALHGEEEMASALAAAAELEGTIDSGSRFVDARFGYADAVGVQLLRSVNDASWMEALRDTAMALAEFAQRAAQNYLERRPAGTFTVDQAPPSHEDSQARCPRTPKPIAHGTGRLCSSELTTMPAEDRPGYSRVQQPGQRPSQARDCRNSSPNRSILRIWVCWG